ncbi:MAG: hypothetical protein V4773_01610 [Verrucomicrobiota bacterium]
MNSNNLSHLLSRRTELLREARLANLAFAYQAMRDFAARVDRARLQGRVTLKPIDPDEERYLVTLTAHDVQQSRIEEHFTDEDLVVFADVLGYATGHPDHELMFHIDQLSEFVAALRADLIHAGVELDEAPAQLRLPG